MNNKNILKIGLAIFLIGGLLWLFSTFEGGAQPRSEILPSGAASDESINIIAFGDSLTAGYGVSQAEAYPAQLEVALREKGYNVTVINSGVSGETTRGNLERANFIRSQNPEIVIFGIGGNDALRALPLEETEKNIRKTIEILQSGEKPPYVILLQMQAPLNAGLAYKRQFDGLYEEIADQYDLPLVPFLTREIYFDSNSKLPDGIHYNRTGYQKVVEQYLMSAVTDVLDEMERLD